MEPVLIDNWESNNGITLGSGAKEGLMRYAHLVHSWNRKKNITGYNTLDEIVSGLLLKSIDPLLRHNVPRGTFLFDLGSGSGSPGIPIALILKGSRMVLIESNQRKATFISRAVDELELKNCSVVCARGEDVARMDEYRQKGDWVFSRAFGPLFITMEIGTPLLKTGGYLYVYGNEKRLEQTERYAEHMENLGLSLEELAGREKEIVFKKDFPSHHKYPRRYAVMKRDAGCID